jgi:hypothetical protein
MEFRTMTKFKLIVVFLLPLISKAQEATDYADRNNWACVQSEMRSDIAEFITDTPSDSIDVFYVYPTLFLDTKDKRWNMDVQDSAFREKVLTQAVKFQASAWANVGKLYVPFYQQAHIRSYYKLENGGKEALLLAYSDIKAAFQYYLDHYNQGKGIILAGHSQGGTHISLLLEDFFDGKPLKQQLVAAYIPGIGIEKEKYDSLKLMTSPDEIGGFVTWNTFKRRVDQAKYRWYRGKEVINPVTWDTTLLATREQHQGFLFSNGKLYTHSFKTHLGNGIIWINTPRFPYRFLAFTMDSYHVGDVNLFWEDIRINAAVRARKYLSQFQY